MTSVLYLNYQDKYFPLQHFATPIIEVCNARGVDSDKLLRGTGIFMPDIVEGKNASAKQLLQLFYNANKFTPGYDCGFQIGRQLIANPQISAIQALHYCRDFSETFRVIALFEHIFSPFISATFIKEQQQGYLLLKHKFGLGKQQQFIIEIFATALVSLSQLLIGHRLKFHFGFEWQRPRYIQEYEENLGFRLSFEQPSNYIAFEIAPLNKATRSKHTLKKWHALHQAKSSFVRLPTLLELIRQQIKQTPNSSLPDVAKQLNISAATLKRKLKEHDVNYTQLHNEVRKHTALDCLLVKGLSNEQSATVMSISDPTNFRRAIKKWTGYTPSQLKAICTPLQTLSM